MSVTKSILLASAAIGCTLVAGAAFAQGVGTRGALSSADAYNNFQRDRSISVRQRTHEGYEALGLRAGAFMVWPKVSATVEHNSNIYATGANEQDDIVFHVAPELNILSTWSRHSLQAYARGTINRFKEFETENTEDYSLGAQGRLDVQRNFRLNGGFDRSRLTEPRTSSSSPTGSVEPIQYDMSAAYASATREFNRLRLSGRYDWREFDYKDGEDVNGRAVRQGDRDRQVSIVTGRADYALSPDTAVFVQVAANDRDYRLKNPSAALYPGFVNRDSQGYEALVGANFELTAVARGEVGVGYISQEFDAPGLNKIDGFGARAQVEWFPTELTTLTFTGSRTVEDAGIIGSSGYLSSNIGAQVDHELLRNVILSGQVGYGKDEYSGIDRADKRYNASVSATYLLNRHAGVTLGYSRFEQKSKGAAGTGSFDVNRIGATLTLQY
jgi:hypothetical protein